MTGPTVTLSGINCGLCRHAMHFDTCGFASVTEDGQTIHLCHGDDHSCYVAWTVGGMRVATVAAVITTCAEGVTYIGLNWPDSEHYVSVTVELEARIDYDDAGRIIGVEFFGGPE